MEFSQGWCDVLEFPATEDRTRQCILNPLQFREIRLCHPGEQRVAIVEPGADYAASDSLSNVIGQRFANMAERADVTVTRLTHSGHVLVERQLPV